MCGVLARRCIVAFCAGVLALVASSQGDEPPAINPFGPKAKVRDDALPGYIETSDGKMRIGHVYITREHRLKVFDEAKQAFREIPLPAVQKIECSVLKEWQEKEWRFKENANNEKVYTGRSYPARQYNHTITLKNGKTIKGHLSAIVYVQGEGSENAERFVLHDRDKGEYGDTLSDLLYVRTVGVGEKAVEEARQKASEKNNKAGKPRKRR
jgi:hypothetical protein